MQFKSPEQALRWAYETSNRPIVKISSINEMRGAESNNSESVTPHDQHAQAAFILGMCLRVLSPMHMAYIEVQFGRNAAGLELLGHQLAAVFGTGVHGRRGIEQVIRSYCGEKIGLRELKKSMSCGMLKAASLRSRGYDALDSIHYQALDTIWREMCNKGLRVAVYSPLVT